MYVYPSYIHLLPTCTCVCLQENCNLNATNTVPMQTALHIAAHEGYTRVIERLIGYGADPNVSDMSGNTPLSDVIRNRAVITTPSEDSPQTLQVLIHVYYSEHTMSKLFFTNSLLDKCVLIVVHRSTRS